MAKMLKLDATLGISRSSIDPEGHLSDEEAERSIGWIVDHVRESLQVECLRRGAELELRTVGNGGRTSAVWSDGDDADDLIKWADERAWDEWCQHGAEECVG